MISFRSIGYLGRLGNQMFQFASAVGISKMTGVPCSFPIENCSTSIGGGPIDPKTGIKMNVKCDLLDCFDIPSEYFVPGNKINPKFIYQENDFKFNPEVQRIGPDTDLYGYFQDERYFLDYRKEIIQIFKFKTDIESRAKTYWEEIISPQIEGFSPVSLHVRRGDYTLYPGHHPVCSKEYYSQAMNEFSEKNVKFLIFSDDIDWCKQEFIGSPFIFIESGSPYSDLKIMTMCDHHIIANSSYSWWGAWLNEKKDPRVVAPSRWFGNLLQKDASEIYCSGWKVI
jgi:hypothetical protein